MIHFHRIPVGVVVILFVASCAQDVNAPDSFTMATSLAADQCVNVDARIDARLHAWGAPAKARLGCLCLQLPDRRSLEPFTMEVFRGSTQVQLASLGEDSVPMGCLVAASLDARG